MRRFLFIVFCSLVFGIGSAHADALNLSNINGTWTNPVGGVNLTGVGTSVVTWGDGAAPDSGYTFGAGPNINGVTLNTPVFLGTFTHNNQPIPSGTAISAIDFNLSFNTNGTPVLISAVFDFLHNETSNLTGTSPADDDIVTITTPIVNVSINQGTDWYFFNLLGFSKDGGATFSNVYSSPEGGNNSAALYGRLTATAVPAPSSLFLMSTALFGFAVNQWRRRRG